MLVGYLTVKETAEKWGINPRTVQTMCNDGRIANAKKFGKAYVTAAMGAIGLGAGIVGGNMSDPLKGLGAGLVAGSAVGNKINSKINSHR